MKKTAFFLFAFLGICMTGMAQNASTTWNKKSARNWFKHGEWQKGLTIQPSPSIDARLFANQYYKHQQRWDKAFEFLNRKDLATLDTGTYPIIGKEVFASVSQYEPKDFAKSQWESHRKYADIQCMIQGEEKIGKAPVSGLTVTVPFDTSKDIAHYKGDGKYYVAKPGTFFIFFPGEAHRPNIKVNPNDNGTVKKIVIKVQAGE